MQALTGGLHPSRRNSLTYPQPLSKRCSSVPRPSSATPMSSTLAFHETPYSEPEEHAEGSADKLGSPEEAQLGERGPDEGENEARGEWPIAPSRCPCPAPIPTASPEHLARCIEGRQAEELHSAGPFHGCRAAPRILERFRVVNHRDFEWPKGLSMGMQPSSRESASGRRA